jgi:hypothetical protein
MKFKNFFNFKTAVNLVGLMKNTFIYKRKNLRNLNEFYLYIMYTFLKPEKVKEQEIEDVEKFITLGFGVFQTSALKESMIKGFKENGINIDKYIELDKEVKKEPIADELGERSDDEPEAGHEKESDEKNREINKNL